MIRVFFFTQVNNLLCFERTDTITGDKLIGKIDTGIKNNYISRDRANNGTLIKLKKRFYFENIYGKILISHYVRVNLFSNNLVFCVVEYIENFDLILGMNGLRKMNAMLDLKSFRLNFKAKNNSKQNTTEFKKHQLLKNLSKKEVISIKIGKIVNVFHH